MKIKNLLDRRKSTWPYYDGHNVQDYHEWFIKDTNIKLGFDYIDKDTNEHIWYKIVSDAYDDMTPYDNEIDFLKNIKWMLMNKNLTWRYYE